nr:MULTISPECIES: pentapeptide repeat-containing protein [unclassified Nostoc]MDZ7988038.1 pentapeptide repeat-containing protein [Nostoc sp. DedVER02]MDZ8114962.1 pentapeptide repeat-containing protein [Nostoc sp. DedVER01b]
MRSANLQGANLKNANLRYANLEWADIGIRFDLEKISVGCVSDSVTHQTRDNSVLRTPF